MLLLILRDLQYRRWRVGLTIVLMAIVIMLLFIMSGLVNQFNTEPSAATLRAAGELNWIVAEGTGGPFTSPRPVDRQALAEVPGEPVLVAPSAVNGFRVNLVARSSGEIAEPFITEGRYPQVSGEILIDETAGFGIDDRVDVGGLPATVVGLTNDATILAGVPLTFVTLDFGQEAATGGRDLLVAKLTDETPAVPAGLKVLTPQEVVADTLLPLEGAVASITLVRALLWLITVIVIAAIIYITALERTRDFAVLKAVGGRTADLGTSLLAQGVIMTLIAVVVGGILQGLVAPSFPLRVRVPPSAWLTISCGAAFAALLAGAAGVWRVKSTSPAEAFG